MGIHLFDASPRTDAWGAFCRCKNYLTCRSFGRPLGSRHRVSLVALAPRWLVEMTKVDTCRQRDLESTTASFGGWFVSPEIAYGYRYVLTCDWSLTPAARVRYVAAQFDGFTESGSTANARTLQKVEERGDLTLTRP
jgi:hypothetical protein